MSCVCLFVFAELLFFFFSSADTHRFISTELWSGKGEPGMNRTSTHLGGFSWTSGVPPCTFRGNTFIDEIPRGQRCDCQAAGVGGVPWAQLGPGTAGLRCQAPCGWSECSGYTCAQAHGPGHFFATHQRPGDELGVGPEGSGGDTGRGQSLTKEGEERVRLRAIHLARLHFSKSMKLGSNLLPGLTYLRQFRISFWAFS